MNKLLIVLLAVCLFSVVSAHAFVKREAPTVADATAQLNAMKEKLTELGSDISKKIGEMVNSEAIKKNLNDLIDGASKTLESIKPTPAAGDAKPAAQ